MPTIELSKRIYSELVALVIDFNDTPEIVIERLINERKENIVPQENESSHSNDAERRKSITRKEAKAIYPLANDVHEGRKEFHDVIDILVNKAGMNKSSARVCVKFLLGMRQGNLYKSKMTANRTAVRYFLEEIVKEGKRENFRMALDSLRQHIEYRKKMKLTDRKLPEVYEDFLKIYNSQERE